MIETKLNRCDNCHNLYEDVDVYDGMRLCPECLNDMRGIDEPSGMDDFDDLDMYGEDMLEEMRAEVVEIKRELKAS